MADGSMQRMLEAAGAGYDRDARIDPYTLLPRWVHPRKSA